jgi:aminopeptidase N
MSTECAHGTPRDSLSFEEAAARAARFADIRHELEFFLSSDSEEFSGKARVTFRDSGQGDSFIDARVGTLELALLNGCALAHDKSKHRIALPAELLRSENTLELAWRSPHEHSGVGFHRFRDPEDGLEYAYTDFEPFSAHRLFPCFDQPDLKARYAVAVTAPKAWKIIANGECKETQAMDGGLQRHVFAELPAFSTYLVAICAGPWHSTNVVHDGINLGVHCRQSLVRFLDAPEIFTITAQGFDFYRHEFAQPYPFGKYDQIFVPEFNSGAMENVGAVTFNESMLFRDPPTEAQRASRAEVILHELAHMWFGNLVTMRWWEDLWLNESFATYISFLAMAESTRFQNGWLAFLSGIKGWALGEDQKPTTHPIAGRVADTEATFLNFDGITYGKGASVLKQLRERIGADSFRNGLRLYFARHAYKNASLNDFLASLSEAAAEDLSPWSALWLETSGVNTLRVTASGLEQLAGNGDAKLRPHVLVLASFGESSHSPLIQRASITHAHTDLPEAFKPAQGRLVWPNQGDHAYARIELDAHSLAIAEKKLACIPDALTRMGIHLSLWDMLRDARLAPAAFIGTSMAALAEESEGELLEAGLRRVAVALHRYVGDSVRESLGHTTFTQALAALLRADVGSERRLTWTRNLVSFAMSQEDASTLLSWIAAAPAGIAVDQGLRWRILARGAAFDLSDVSTMLADELIRDPSDRGRKAVLAAECASSAQKLAIFERFVAAKESHDLLKHAMPHFFQAHQRAQVERFSELWVDALPQVLEHADFEYLARGFARLLAPHAVASDALESRLSALLANLPATAAPLRRILREELDELQRTLKLRALA